jgi:hypothetical protein
MSYTVTLSCDPVEPRNNWAKENCPSYITNVLDYVGPGGGLVAELSIKYYFGEEKDAVLFALRWT